MNPILHDSARLWRVATLLVAHFGLGLLAGTLYFRALRRAAGRLIAGASLGGALRDGAARFAGLGAVLCLAAHEGAAPLLCMAAGVLLARFAMLRAPRESAA